MDKEKSDSSDEIVEEVLVYADFDSALDHDNMFQSNSLFKVIALDSDEPFLQIGTQMYSGKWQDSVGEHLFFEPEEAPPPSDPIFSDVSTTQLNYKYKTRKCLDLSRIFINKKEKDVLEQTTPIDNEMNIDNAANLCNEKSDQSITDTTPVRKLAQEESN